MNSISRTIVVSIVLAVVTGVAVPAAAQWVRDGVPVCTDVNVAGYLSVTDGSGGAILVWVDRRDSDYTLFAQRINADGYVRWTVNGDSVSSFAAEQYLPAAVADGEGGVVIAFFADYFEEGEEKLNGYILAQRLDSSGTRLWGDDGTVVRYDTTIVGPPAITLDATGSVVIAWADERSLVDMDIYAQKLNSTGNVVWTGNGIPICIASGPQYNTQIIADEAGGVIIGWQDHRNSDADIFAQKLDGSGITLWPTDGAAVCVYSFYTQNYPVMTTDGAGGAIFAWEDNRNFFTFVYAQRIDNAGTLGWGTTGIIIISSSIAGKQHQWPRIVSDGSGGAIISYEYGSGAGLDIYAQRLDGSGVHLWGGDGLVVCDQPGDQQFPAISPRTGGGAVIAWIDGRVSPQDIFVQIVDSNGNLLLSETGGAVTTAPGYQVGPLVVSDDTGGGIVTWGDGTNMDDLYAQHISETEGWYTSDPEILAIEDITPDEGGWVRIRLRASIYDNLDAAIVAISYNVWRKIAEAAPLLSGLETVRPALTVLTGDDLRLMPSDPGDAARVSGSQAAALGLPPGEWESLGMHPATQDSLYSFAVPTGADSTSEGIPWETYAVSVHTTSPGFYIYSSPDSGYSVDNLAPGAPLGLAAEQSYAPEGLQLSWDAGGEGDLWHYAVYRGTSSDFMPDAGSRIGQPTDPELFDGDWTWDGGYWYKVAAVDRHGNESVFAVTGPGGITGDDPMPLPDATFLAQNYPNPFNPITNIGFGLKESGHISIRIYDAAGRLVITLVDESRPAGRYTTEWNGQNTDGSSAASGVYFYKIVAGDFVQTRKMVLLR